MPHQDGAGFAHSNTQVFDVIDGGVNRPGHRRRHQAGQANRLRPGGEAQRDGTVDGRAHAAFPQRGRVDLVGAQHDSVLRFNREVVQHSGHLQQANRRMLG